MRLLYIYTHIYIYNIPKNREKSSQTMFIQQKKVSYCLKIEQNTFKINCIEYMNKNKQL